MKILESAENYLETILMIQRKEGSVRSIDIANELNFSKPSISVAMKHLKEDEYIQMDPKGFITLTDKGRKVAEQIYDRHQLIAKILINLGVNPETAYEDSCKIEHDLSQESYDKIKEFVSLRNTICCRGGNSYAADGNDLERAERFVRCHQ